MRVGVRDLFRLPPRGVRVAIDEGVFLRFVRHNPTPHSPLGSLRSAVSHRGHLAGAYMFRAVSIAWDFSAVSHRGHLAGAGVFRAVSIAGDFSTNARNDILFVCFYTAGGLKPTFNSAERKKSYVFLARRFLMKILNDCLTAEISFDAPQGKRGENRPTVLRVRRAI